MSYQEIEGGMVLRIADGAVIPNDPGNRDRQTFAAWVAAGNTAQPMDPGWAKLRAVMAFGQDAPV